VPFSRRSDRANSREKLGPFLGLDAGKNPEIWFADRISAVVSPNQRTLQARNNIWSHGRSLETRGIRKAGGVPEKCCQVIEKGHVPAATRETHAYCLTTQKGQAAKKTARLKFALGLRVISHCGTRAKKTECRVKYWETIADKLSKAGWTWAMSQPWIAKGERSGSWMHTATTASGLSHARMKS
jgi:hypothetical protein